MTPEAKGVSIAMRNDAQISSYLPTNNTKTDAMIRMETNVNNRLRCTKIGQELGKGRPPTR